MWKVDRRQSSHIVGRIRQGGFAVSILLATIHPCFANDAKNFIAAVKIAKSLPLSKLMIADVQCVYPIGVVVAEGEAMHMFKTKNIDVRSVHNSHGFWYIVFYRENKKLVTIFPVGIFESDLSNDDFLCGKNIHLKYENGAMTAELR